jgi:hypothetical protein
MTFINIKGLGALTSVKVSLQAANSCQKIWTNSRMRPARRKGDRLEMKKLKFSNAEHPGSQQKVEPQHGQ